MCLIEKIEIVYNLFLFGWEGKKKWMKQIIILCWLLLYNFFLTYLLYKKLIL